MTTEPEEQDAYGLFEIGNTADFGDHGVTEPQLI